MPELAEWESFYLIIGGAAGALVGLQFVFMTLIAALPRPPGREGGAAFGTPTIVHFCAALLVAAVLRVPWRTMASVATVCSLLGVIGIGYSIVVTVRMARQNTYRPEVDDWAFYALLPGIGYVVLAVFGFVIFTNANTGLFGVAASSLLLLFIGIRNSWDSVTYHVLSRPRDHHDSPTGSSDEQGEHEFESESSNI